MLFARTAIDQFIDLIEGNRKYVKCLCIYNKIDGTSIEEVQRIMATPHSVVLSCYEPQQRPGARQDLGVPRPRARVHQAARQEARL